LDCLSDASHRSIFSRDATVNQLIEAQTAHAPRRLRRYVEGARRLLTGVRLDALPLSPNGKMDRAALPQPDSVQIAQDEYVAPTTPTAIARTKIFEEVLHMDPVGATGDRLKMGADCQPWVNSNAIGGPAQRPPYIDVKAGR
jgi:hypothetical protein